MDEQLAAIYGTGQQAQAEDDMEKAAAAELLVKLAEQEGVDLNQLSDSDVAELLNDLYKTAAEGDPEADGEESSSTSPESKTVTSAGEGEPESSSESEETKAESEKCAEADFLGRVMAHAMVQELNSIEKEAGFVPSPSEAKKLYRLSQRFVGGAATKAERAAAKAKAGRGFFAGRPEAYRGAGKDISRAFGKRDPIQGFAPSIKERLGLVGSAAKKVAPELAVAGGGTAVGIAAHKLRAKKKEAGINAQAQQRAYELAKQAGWVDQQGNMITPQVKQAEAIDPAIEQRALQLLEANGYPVQWNA